MALMNQHCGPKASPFDWLDHRFIEFEDLFSCDFCGEHMSHAEAKRWMEKYATKIETHQTGRREGGTG